MRTQLVPMLEHFFDKGCCLLAVASAVSADSTTTRSSPGAGNRDSAQQIREHDPPSSLNSTAEYRDPLQVDYASLLWCMGTDQPLAPGHDGRLRPIGYLQFAQDRAHIALHGVLT